MQGVKQSWENSLQTPKIAKIYIFRTLWKWLLQRLLFLKQKMQAYHLSSFSANKCFKIVGITIVFFIFVRLILFNSKNLIKVLVLYLSFMK